MAGQASGDGIRFHETIVTQQHENLHVPTRSDGSLIEGKTSWPVERGAFLPGQTRQICLRKYAPCATVLSLGARNGLVTGIRCVIVRNAAVAMTATGHLTYALSDAIPGRQCNRLAVSRRQGCQILGLDTQTSRKPGSSIRRHRLVTGSANARGMRVKTGSERISCAAASSSSAVRGDYCSPLPRSVAEPTCMGPLCRVGADWSFDTKKPALLRERVFPKHPA